MWDNEDKNFFLISSSILINREKLHVGHLWELKGSQWVLYVCINWLGKWHKLAMIGLSI